MRALADETDKIFSTHVSEENYVQKEIELQGDKYLSI
jgi:hypothetical protein